MANAAYRVYHSLVFTVTEREKHLISAWLKCRTLGKQVSQATPVPAVEVKIDAEKCHHRAHFNILHHHIAGLRVSFLLDLVEPVLRLTLVLVCQCCGHLRWLTPQNKSLSQIVHLLGESSNVFLGSYHSCLRDECELEWVSFRHSNWLWLTFSACNLIFHLNCLCCSVRFLIVTELSSRFNSITRAKAFFP